MQISLEVDLFKRDQPLGSTTTKDISIGGMTLQNTQSNLYTNDLIEIRIWIHGKEQFIRALVIHTRQNNAGVMLLDMKKEVSRAYFNFLNEMGVPLKVALGSYTQNQ
jgi:hypothetical protein